MNFCRSRLREVSKCALFFAAFCGLSACNQIKTENATKQLALLNELASASQDRTLAEGAFSEQLAKISERQDHMQSLLLELQKEVRKQQAQIKREQQVQNNIASDQQAAEKTRELGESEILNGKSLLGRVEWLWLPGYDRYFAAQLDTAIEESLIFAGAITRFEREGEPWVRFELERGNRVTELEAEVIESGRFSYPGMPSSSRGLLISLPVELSRYGDATEFFVIERKQNYPQFVLGRNFLTDVAVVDVSRKYIFPRDPEKRKLESQSDANTASKKSSSSGKVKAASR